ncbi:MAG: hypothetical protein KVP17_004340 [Porospora cf. gigantea B]|uniref:uncharacterized protein n=1 Tax=Porospora cf. gigantea B TaxID=2853592 RepID=UPI003571A9D0|nr:MAG: hypothetical protein KVP17_004340 [Porospora cf. gigantea B]
MDNQWSRLLFRSFWIGLVLLNCWNFLRRWNTEPQGTPDNPMFTSRWESNESLDAFVFVSNRRPNFHLKPDVVVDDLLWHRKNFSREGLQIERMNVTWTPQHVQPTTRPLYVHMFVGPQGFLGAGPTEFRKVVADSEALIAMMEPFGDEELKDLWDLETRQDVTVREPVEHWKAKLDLRLVGLPHQILREKLSRVPGAYLSHADPQTHEFTPICWLHDFWMLERHFVPLSDLDTFQLEISFGLQPLWSHGLISNMKNNWEADPEDRPLAGLHQHTRREMMMVKRILMDTNPYFLMFSFVFMGTHVLFQMLALKNDVSFWNSKDGMEGMSAYTLIYGFVSEFVIALYLLDSQNTSRLVLLEILLGLGASGWKLTKGVKVKMSRSFPFVHLEDQKNYAESGTKDYDRYAIKVMSVVMFPPCLGYCVYSYYYKKHRSLYSYLVSCLAGLVYSFGFVMMCPQLYINYKLQSVDHLPWRAMIYRALDTFVDDVGAFLVDMPLLHRLATFRDDIIFVLYLYQRWAYRVDKTRPTLWNHGDTEQLEISEHGDTTEAEQLEISAEMPTISDAPADPPVRRR